MTEDRELHIGRGGLWIPPELREFDQQIVFRTPRSTIQHFGSQPLEGYYGMIDESHFGDDVEEGQNPSLAPDRVSIKPQGEDAREFRVDTDPDVRCDGGQSGNETERWQRPWIETEADAIDEAAQSAYEMIMEDPDDADQETFEWSTEYQAENYNIKNRLDDVRRETQEKSSRVIPKAVLEQSLQPERDGDE